MSKIEFYMTEQGLVMYAGDSKEDKEKLEKLQHNYQERQWELRKFINNIPVIPKCTERYGLKPLFLIGIAPDGTKMWLEQHKFECEWYWSIGNVVYWEKNKRYDKNFGWTHLNSMMEGTENVHTNFLLNISKGTTLTHEELWKFLELVELYYITEKYYEMLYIKGAHISSAPEHIKNLISNQPEMERLRDKVIPGICREVHDMLDPMKINKKEDNKNA